MEHVNLRGTKVTDVGLAHLAGLNDLGHVALNGVAVTDAGLEHLKGLKKLTSLLL